MVSGGSLSNDFVSSICYWFTYLFIFLLLLSDFFLFLDCTHLCCTQSSHWQGCKLTVFWCQLVLLNCHAIQAFNCVMHPPLFFLHFHWFQVFMRLATRTVLKYLVNIASITSKNLMYDWSWSVKWVHVTAFLWLCKPHVMCQNVGILLDNRRGMDLRLNNSFRNSNGKTGSGLLCLVDRWGLGLSL